MRFNRRFKRGQMTSLITNIKNSTKEFYKTRSNEGRFLLNNIYLLIVYEIL